MELHSNAVALYRNEKKSPGRHRASEGNIGTFFCHVMGMQVSIYLICTQVDESSDFSINTLIP